MRCLGGPIPLWRFRSFPIGANIWMTGMAVLQLRPALIETVVGRRAHEFGGRNGVEAVADRRDARRVAAEVRLQASATPIAATATLEMEYMFGD